MHEETNSAVDTAFDFEASAALADLYGCVLPGVVGSAFSVLVLTVPSATKAVAAERARKMGSSARNRIVRCWATAAQAQRTRKKAYWARIGSSGMGEPRTSSAGSVSMEDQVR